MSFLQIMPGGGDNDSKYTIITIYVYFLIYVILVEITISFCIGACSQHFLSI